MDYGYNGYMDQVLVINIYIFIIKYQKLKKKPIN